MNTMSHGDDIWTHKTYDIITKYSAGVGTQAQTDDDIDDETLKKMRHRKEKKRSKFLFWYPLSVMKWLNLLDNK